MRNFIDIMEEWALTLPKSISGATNAQIYKNPTRAEFGKWLREHREGQCRATMSRSGNLYVWLLDDAFHEEVQDAIEEPMLPVSLFCIWPNKEVHWSELPYWKDDDGVWDAEVVEYGRIILRSPALRSLYGANWKLIGEADDQSFSIEIDDEWLNKTAGVAQQPD